MVQQFTVHAGLPDGSAAPIHRMFTLYGKLREGKKLSKEEKEYVAGQLWGTMGANSSTFRLGGFAAPFYRYLPQILVKQHGSWQEYHAPDKTSLRKALYGPIDQMTYVD